MQLERNKYQSNQKPYEMQSNRISFKGQKIYVGIDVHLKKWSITVITEKGFKHTHAQKASARELLDFLERRYPEGEYHAVYESGFSGFSTFYSLRDVGINCIVINPADIPTSQYEKVMKTDSVDSEKLAKALRAGLLTPIYIREKENLDDRAVMRIRKTAQAQLSSYKIRVKHLLHQNGVEFPERFDRPGTYWSGAFIRWLKDEVVLLSSTRLSLDLLINQVLSMRKNVLDCTRELRKISQSDKYRERFNLLLSVPGIGMIVAMCILTEIYDIKRFSNERQFASYLGLIPTCHCSGEKVSHGEKTYRGNKVIGPLITEASWVAIQKDQGLNAAYGHYCQRMKPHNAIIRIARKLSNIIFHVLKNNIRYEPYQWDKDWQKTYL